MIVVIVALVAGLGGHDKNERQDRPSERLSLLAAMPHAANLRFPIASHLTKRDKYNPTDSICSTPCAYVLVPLMHRSISSNLNKDPRRRR